MHKETNLQSVSNLLKAIQLAHDPCRIRTLSVPAAPVSLLDPGGLACTKLCSVASQHEL